jgi:superfamily II DNA or RNA helicase
MELSLSDTKKYLLIDDCTEQEYDQLKLSLTKRIEGWKFHPLVKKGLWDGFITFMKGNKIPSGLWKEIIEIGNDFGFSVNINGLDRLFDKEINREEFIKWCNDFFENNPKKPRDYQIETAYRILKFRRCLAELATSAGKSLILFIVIAYLIKVKELKKILLIVPNVSLVLQATDDFDEYDCDEKLKLKIQQIYAGTKLKTNCSLIVGTYQSLVKKNQEYYNSFDVAIIDETHRAKGASITSVMDKMWHAAYRFGVSGTVPRKGTIERLSLMSQTGPLIMNVNASFLMEQEFITKCEITVINMRYATEEQMDAFSYLSKTAEDRKKLFVLEQNFVIENRKRLKFITKVINKSSKNSLVLFHRIEHGKAIIEELKKYREQDVFYVDGSISADDRDDYKKFMEQGEGKLLVASFGTFSTGINITNIHNIFLTESFKSEIVIRQSIGRGLRLNPTKEKLIIIDFVDDFRCKMHDGKIFQNYLYKHGIHRRTIYDDQGFPYKIVKAEF